MNEGDHWFYQIGTEVLGPTGIGDLKNLFAAGQVESGTLIYHNAADGWVRLDSALANLQQKEQAGSERKLHRSVPPPIPHYVKANRPGATRTIQIAIVCVTVLVGLWLWKGSDQKTIITTSDGQTITVDISAIKSVIKQDAQVNDEETSGQFDRKTDEDLDSWAQRIRNYVARAKKIDTSACPRDFSEAYFRHVSAWSDLADAIAGHPHIRSDNEALVEGFFRGMAGDPSGGAFEHQEEFNQWWQLVSSGHDNVNQTWQNVEALEIRYGAK